MAHSSRRPLGVLEVCALLALTLGVLVAGPLGALLALVLVICSRVWSTRQKVLALVPAVSVTSLFLIGVGVIGSFACTSVDGGPEVCEPHTPLAIVWMTIALLVLAGVASLVELARGGRSNLPGGITVRVNPGKI